MIEQNEKLDAKKRKQLLDRAKSRQISQVILDYGLSDNQIKELIKLLALELEDREIMVKIYEFLNDNDEIPENEVKVFV